MISDLATKLAKLDSTLAKLDTKLGRPDTRPARSDGSYADGTVEDNAYALKRARLRKIIAEKQAELASLPMIERELQQRQTDVDVEHGIRNRGQGIEGSGNQVRRAAGRAPYLPALVPQLPSKPRRFIFLGVAALTGLLVGVALAFFLEYINRTARRIDDIEDFVGLKVIGTIPLARLHHGGRPPHR